MAKKSRQSKYANFPKWLLLFVVLGALWGAYRFYPRQSAKTQPIEIMAIDPVAITYGETVITGTIQKDAAASEDGNFILVLADMRPVMLDVQGLDHLIGLQATAQGNLSPALADYLPMTMRVQSISIAQE